MGKANPIRLRRLAWGACLALVGCATSPPPSSQQPALPVAFSQAEPSQTLAVPADRWWTTVHDDTLAHLIETAQAANQDVGIALARVAQARAAVRAVDSRRDPELDAGGAASTSHSGLPDAVKRGMPDTRALQLNLSLSWELDLMGAAAAAAAGARADLLGAEWGVRGAQQLVANEVARQYLLACAARREQAVTQALVDTYAFSERLVQVRVREGIASGLDLDRLHSEQASASARLPGYRAQRVAAEAALAVLIGRMPPLDSAWFPPSAPSTGDPLDPAPLLRAGEGLLADPGTPPVGQPAALLLRRPDVQAAAARDQAEQARRQEATADRYPRFFLSALFGGERLALNGVPYPAAAYSNAALAFSAPLFDGDRRAAREAVQRGRADEAGIAYQQAILRAIQEVDSSLAGLAAQRARYQYTLAARDQALSALQRVRTLQAEGEIDQVGVLDLVRRAFDAQLAVLDAERDRGLALVQLYAALGGGWSPGDASAPSIPAAESRP